VIQLFQFKRRNPGQVFAWSTYDFANSAFATTILAVIFNKYYAGIVAGGAEGVRVFGTQVPGATMFTIFVALGMILIAVASPVLAAFSDLGRLKRRMLTVHMVIGAIATLALAGIAEGDWLIGGIIFVIAQFGFAGGNVFYNAMIYDIAEPEDFGKVSAIGWAWGYIGGGLLLAINLVMLQFPQLLGMPEGYFTVQDCFISVAVWWVLFSIPLLVSFKESGTADKKLRATVRSAVRDLRHGIRRLRSLPEYARFFVAYLLYNDGVETVIVMAAIFGDQELKMDSSQLVTFFLMIQGVAFAGALLFGELVEKFGNRRSLLISLIVWMFVAVWGWQIGIFGNAITEYWILGAVSAIVMGGSQAASRSLQAMLIPPARSAEFFSFFAISGKFAGAVGPLLFGAAVFITGSLRAGILSLIFLFLFGFLVLLTVNEAKGRQQALAFDTHDNG
jgi:UMF1 family MFS transporter